jgi:DMSO/TMAO reductase YedYZ molybdopterin-dependent catalytic subunit
VSRRRFIVAAGAAVITASTSPRLSQAEVLGSKLPGALPEGTRMEALLDALPGKKPLIKLSYRPPNYETPIEYFRTTITPNDAFFVRYHLSDIPEVDAATWKVSVGGEGANSQTELTLDDLHKMAAVEVVAVNQCSGNRRGLFQPHVPGVEWGYGLRALEGHSAPRRAGQGRPQEGSDRNCVRRSGWTGYSADAGFHQEYSCVEGN